jgi:hypothetical protein
MRRDRRDVQERADIFGHLLVGGITNDRAVPMSAFGGIVLQNSIGFLRLNVF